MARIKLSALLQSMTGRYGGGVFRDWKGITVLGSLPITVSDPSSLPQARFRDMLTVIGKKFRALTQTQRGCYEALAAALRAQWEHYSNEAGTHHLIRTPRAPYTAAGACASMHALLNTIQIWSKTDALIPWPIGNSAPSAPTLGNLSGSTAGLVIPWTDPASLGTGETSGMVRVWIKSDDGKRFTQWAGSYAYGVGTATITSLRCSGGGAPAPLTKGMYWVQLDAVGAAGGMRSLPSACEAFSIIS